MCRIVEKPCVDGGSELSRYEGRWAEKTCRKKRGLSIEPRGARPLGEGGDKENMALNDDEPLK